MGVLLLLVHVFGMVETNFTHKRAGGSKQD